MPRNYDEMAEAEDRTFIIRGETFHVKRCAPAVMGELAEMEKEFLAREDVGYPEIAEFAEKRLLVLIDDQNGAVGRWQTLRGRAEDPVTYGEIVDVSKWAVEAITNLPTMPPSPSAPGRGKVAASSKAE